MLFGTVLCIGLAIMSYKTKAKGSHRKDQLVTIGIIWFLFLFASLIDWVCIYAN